MEDVTFENWEALAPLADASPEELAEAIRFVLDAKRGRDIAVIPVVGRSDITDCLVLASATSSTHVRALAGEVEYRLGQRGVQLVNRILGIGMTRKEGNELCLSRSFIGGCHGVSFPDKEIGLVYHKFSLVSIDLRMILKLKRKKISPPPYRSKGRRGILDHP